MDTAASSINGTVYAVGAGALADDGQYTMGTYVNPDFDSLVFGSTGFGRGSVYRHEIRTGKDVFGSFDGQGRLVPTTTTAFSANGQWVIFFGPDMAKAYVQGDQLGLVYLRNLVTQQTTSWPGEQFGVTKDPVSGKLSGIPSFSLSDNGSRALVSAGVGLDPAAPTASSYLAQLGGNLTFQAHDEWPGATISRDGTSVVFLSKADLGWGTAHVNDGTTVSASTPVGALYRSRNGVVSPVSYRAGQGMLPAYSSWQQSSDGSVVMLAGDPRDFGQTWAGMTAVRTTMAGGTSTVLAQAAVAAPMSLSPDGRYATLSVPVGTCSQSLGLRSVLYDATSGQLLEVNQTAFGDPVSPCFNDGTGQVSADGSVVTFVNEQGAMALDRTGRPPAERMNRGASGAWTFNTAEELADPVNPYLGDFTLTETDASLPSIDVPVVLARSYDSAGNGTAGWFGFGWTSGLDTRLTFGAAGTVTLVAEQLVTFCPSAGGYVGPPGGRAKLVHETSDWVLTRYDQTTFRFDAAGLLKSVTGSNGKGVTMRRNSATSIDAISTSASKIHFLLSPVGRVTSAAMPDGTSITYTYDLAGNLTSVTDASGGTQRYQYDGQHRMTATVDALGQTQVSNVYGPDGRVTDQDDALGKRTHFGWNQSTETATVTDARGAVSTYEYANSMLMRATAPDGAVTSYAYDSSANVVAVKSAAAGGVHVTRLTYNDAGEVLSSTRPDGAIERQTLDGNHHVLTQTDVAGRLTTNAFDAAGNLVATTGPGNLTSTATRAAGTGLVSQTTSPGGKITKYRYNTAGQVTQVTSPGGAVTSLGYDSLGRRTSLVDSLAKVAGAVAADHTWTTTYNVTARTIATTDPLGHRTLTQLDAVGQQTAVTDPRGNTERFGYDAAHELVSVTDPDGNATAYAYDDSGNLTARVDPNGNRVSYGYDQAKHLVAVDAPLAQAWRFTYDQAGNRRSSSNPLSAVQSSYGQTSFTYNALNAATTTSYGDPADGGGGPSKANRRALVATAASAYAPVAASSTATTYDILQRVTRITNNNGSVDHGFDPAGRVSAVTSPAGVVRLTYNADSQVLSRQAPDGTTTTYTYTGDGQIASRVVGAKTTRYTYDIAGRLTGVVKPDGTSETRTYDAVGQLTRQQVVKGTVTVSDHRYTYDPNGNPTGSVSSLLSPLVAGVTQSTGTLTTAATYDAENRLTATCNVSCPDPTGSTYTYDSVGNLRSAATPAGTSSYPTNAADQLTAVTGAGAGALTYDAAGQLIHDKTRSYQYDVAGKLISVATTTAITTYTYNADGTKASRVSTPITGGAATTTGYVWDTTTAVPTLIAETNAQGQTIRRYDYGPSGVEAVTNGTTTSYLHSDALGSIDSVTTSAGVVVSTTRYSPWGVQAAHATGANPPTIPVGYTGQNLDPTTSLYDLRARMYDPDTARFTTPDPLPVGAAAAVSRYTYVDDQPTVKTDPTGLRGDYAGVCPEWLAWNDFACSHFQKLGPTAQGLVVVAVEVGPYIVSLPRAGLRITQMFLARAGARLLAKGAADSGLINPSTVRFSQNSISAAFKDGGTVKGLAADLRSGAVNPSDVPAIRLVERDGNLFTLDNRRLAAFQEAGVDIPYRMATPQEIANEGWKFTTTNDGTSILIRGGG